MLAIQIAKQIKTLLIIRKKTKAKTTHCSAVHHNAFSLYLCGMCVACFVKFSIKQNTY